MLLWIFMVLSCVLGASGRKLDCLHLTTPEYAELGQNTNFSCRMGDDAQSVDGGLEWHFRNSSGFVVHRLNLKDLTGYTWERWRHKVDGFYDSSTRTHFLEIKNVHLDDEGQWGCMYDGYNFSACRFEYVRANFTVHVPTSDPIMWGISGDHVGKDVPYKLLCSVATIKTAGRVVWLVGGLEASTESTATLNADGKTYSLFGNSTVSFDGSSNRVLLQCKVMDHTGQELLIRDYKHVDVLFLVSTSVQNRTSHPPISGTELRLWCHVTDGSPPPTMFSWRRDYTNLTGQAGQELEIVLDETRDAGSYSCRGQNDLGWGEFSERLKVNVWYEPMVYITIPSTPVTESENVTIECRMTAGYPGLSLVQWQFNGAPLDDESDLSGGTVDSPSLSIRNVGPQHHGAYVCTLGNAAGSTSSSSVDLIVYYAPKGRPELTTNKAKVDIGEFVMFTCHNDTMHQRPRLNYFLFFDGSGAVVGNASQPQWTMLALSARQGGRYSCAAGNEVGVGERSAGVRVRVKDCTGAIVGAVCVGLLMGAALWSVIMFMVLTRRATAGTSSSADDKTSSAVHLEESAYYNMAMSPATVYADIEPGGEGKQGLGGRNLPSISTGIYETPAPDHQPQSVYNRLEVAEYEMIHTDRG